MNTTSQGTTLRVSGFDSLSGPSAAMLRELVQASLDAQHRTIEVDMTRATFVDSEGLGALVALHKGMKAREGAVRLRSVAPMIRDLLRLTGIEFMFEFSEAG